MTANIQGSEEGRIAGMLFWLLVLAAMVHMSYYYPFLPERVASHFDSHGRPNGWSSKGAFIMIYALVTLLMAVLYGGIKYVLPRLPNSLINLPNKNYWFAPARKVEAMAVIRRNTAVFFSASLMFLIGTMHLAIGVNVGRSRTLGQGFFVFLLSYLAFVIVWAIRLIRRFSASEIRDGEK